MKKRTGHLYSTTDLARSALDGVEITAICGFTRTFTRDDLDGEWGDRSCTTCLAGLAEEQDNGHVTYRTPMTYVDLLEEWVRDLRRPRATVHVNTNGATNWTFPLAG